MMSYKKAIMILFPILLCLQLMTGCESDGDSVVSPQQTGQPESSSAAPVDTVPTQPVMEIPSSHADLNNTIREEPVPADLTGKLDWFPEAIGVKVGYTLAPMLSESGRHGEKTLTTEEKKELLKLLLSEPVYLFNDDPQEAMDQAIRIDADFEKHRLYFMAMSDGSVRVGADSVQYISNSKALYDYMIGLTAIDAFDMEVLDSVQSISVRYKNENGDTEKKTVDDREIVDGITRALSSADAAMYRNSFLDPPDLEITLHADGRDILCTVYGTRQLGSSEETGVFAINRVYWYRSPEAVELIRSLAQ